MDLSMEIPELDTASFWYVSETDVYFLLLLIISYDGVPSLGVEKMDISENLL